MMAPMLCQPRTNPSVLVRALVVWNQMRVQVGRNMPVRVVEERHELLMAMASLTLADYFALGKIECGRQRGHAMSEIILDNALDIA